MCVYTCAFRRLQMLVRICGFIDVREYTHTDMHTTAACVNRVRVCYGARIGVAARACVQLCIGARTHGVAGVCHRACVELRA